MSKRSTTLQVLLDRYLQNVKPSGRGNFRAACPFHSSSSSNRSLYIRGDTGHWSCFGCDLGGAVHGLLYKLGLSRRLVDAEIAKLDFTPTQSQKVQQKLAIQRRPVHVLPEFVLGAYEYCSETMLDLGFQEEFLQEHDIGYDEKQRRITFPLRDFRGQLTAVSGRADAAGVFPRYKVYEEEFQEAVPGYRPESGRYLYNFHNVYPHRYFHPTKATGPILVVEGYKGCLWQVQSGYRDVVALQGSYLTPEQEMLLRLLRGPYVVWLDWEPGKAFPHPDADRKWSARRIVKRLSRYGPTRMVWNPDLKEGTSPDDLSAEETSSLLKNHTLTPAQLAAKTSRRWTRSAPTRETTT